MQPPASGPHADVFANRVRRAAADIRSGRYDKARRSLQKVLEQQPDHASALHFMGVLLFRQGDAERAISLIRQSLDAAPEYDDAIKNLGNILLELERHEEAEACYRRGIALHPEDGTAYGNLCVALRHQGKFKQAVRAGRKATSLLPSHYPAWYNLGNAYHQAGNHSRSIRCFERCLEIMPDFSPAWDNYCQAVLSKEKSSWLGRRSLTRTRAAYQKWLAVEPDSPVATFMLGAIAGDSSLKQAPEAFIQDVFDRAAPEFEHRLTGLKYRVPTLFGQALKDVMGPPDASLAVLDGGCGTGWCGPALRPYAARLIGVDLSAGMLEKARARGLYDELIESELTAWFRDCDDTFDLVVFADVFCYIGDLEPLMSAVSNALKPGGWVMFSAERLPDRLAGSDYLIHPHGRYAHAHRYVVETVRSARLAIVSDEHEVIRLERGAPVDGTIIVAHKSFTLSKCEQN